MITSPSPAVRLLYREALPPRTLKHITSLAPVLSATSSRVCIWIMGHPGKPWLLYFDRWPVAGGRDLAPSSHRFVHLGACTRSGSARGLVLALIPGGGHQGGRLAFAGE